MKKYQGQIIRRVFCNICQFYKKRRNVNEKEKSKTHINKKTQKIDQFIYSADSRKKCKTETTSVSPNYLIEVRLK